MDETKEFGMSKKSYIKKVKKMEKTALVNNLMSAVRKNCLDCMANQIQEIRACVSLKCPLWDFRMGSKPDGSPIFQRKLFKGKENLKSLELLKEIGDRG